MPPTFHYRPEPSPTYTYTDTIDNVTYTRRVSHSPKKLYWDDSFTRAGELTPTFIHTTTTLSSDGSIDGWTEESTHRYRKCIRSYKYPAFLECRPASPSCYDKHRNRYRRHVSPPRSPHRSPEGPFPVPNDPYPPPVIDIPAATEEDLLVWAKNYRLPLPPDVQRIRNQYEVERGWRQPDGAEHVVLYVGI